MRYRLLQTYLSRTVVDICGFVVQQAVAEFGHTNVEATDSGQVVHTRLRHSMILVKALTPLLRFVVDLPYIFFVLILLLRTFI